MNKLLDILHTIDSYFGGSTWFVCLLFGAGLMFTLYLGFPQIRYFGKAWKELTSSKHSGVGETSKWGALSTALSSTIGTGNIAGVGLAIFIGGPSALFWMFVCAFFGMGLKMVEVTLAHKYREISSDGIVNGGPMYYMKNRLNMKWMGGIFSIATVTACFGTGSLPQMNSMSSLLEANFNIPPIVTGILITVIIGLVLVGGIKRIAQVNVRLTPFMGFVYIVGALTIIVCNYDNILPSLSVMFKGVFSGNAAFGGFLGTTAMMAFNRGLNRGLFSNEAGQGSSPIVHATSKVSESLREGFIALLEPFFDTMVICMLTGLAILSSGAWYEKTENKFQQADMYVLNGVYNEKDNLKELHAFVMKEDNSLLYTGIVSVKDGMVESPITIINAKSVAEDVVVSQNGNKYSGLLNIENGKIKNYSDYQFNGKSLLHSAQLSSFAFSKGWFGNYGQWIVTLCLFLFSFSTAISWSYYGNVSIAYLFGQKYVIVYKIVYLLSLLAAVLTDTTVIWAISAITTAFMALPNLIALILLRKDVKKIVENFKNGE